MRVRACAPVVIAVSLVVATAPPAAGKATAASRRHAGSQRTVPGEILVRFRIGTRAPVRSEVRRMARVRLEQRLGVPGLELVRVRGDHTVTATIRSLERRRSVRYAEPNYIYDATSIPNDPLFSQQIGLNNIGQVAGGWQGTPDADIDAPGAWNMTTGGNVVVGVVDTGVAWDHPDLIDNIWQNPGEAGAKATNGIDDDGDGLVDDVRGWDWANNDNDPRATDAHGTHVAGIIGARGNNGIGLSGVAQRVKIMPLKTAADGEDGLRGSAIVSALVYAGQHGAQVVNGSFDGAAASGAIRDAVAAAPNTLFVFAAGNAANDNDASPNYPCSYTLPNVVCVAASTPADTLASFSNWGLTSVDLAAPGVAIDSTIPSIERPYEDDLETTPIPSRWVSGGTNNTWGWTTARSTSGTHSLTDSPAGSYAANTNSWIQTAAPIDLTGKSNCAVSYQVAPDLQQGRDFLVVEATTTPTVAASWTPLATALTGSDPAHFYNFGGSLKNFSNSLVYVRFRLTSDASGQGDGVYLDDFGVVCAKTTYDDSDYAFMSGTSMASPVVAGTAALYLSLHPGASVATTKSALLAAVDPKPAFAGKTVSGGRLNAAKLFDSTPPDAFAVTGPSDGAWFNPYASAVTLAWNPATDSQSGVEWYRVYLDGALRNAFVPATSTSTPLGIVTAEGVHTWHVDAVDAAGNATSSGNRLLGIDRSVPDEFLLSEPAMSAVTGATPALSWTPAVDSLSGIDRYDVIVDSKRVKSVPGDTTTTTLDTPLADGGHIWYVQAVDRAGNVRSVNAARILYVKTTSAQPEPTPTPGEPEPEPQPTPGPDLTAPIVTLGVVAKQKVATIVKSGIAAVCAANEPSSCVVTAKLSVRDAKALGVVRRATGTQVQIATAKGRIAAAGGGSTTLRLKLTRAARSALQKAAKRHAPAALRKALKRARVTVLAAVTDSSGNQGRATKTVRLVP